MARASSYVPADTPPPTTTTTVRPRPRWSQQTGSCRYPAVAVRRNRRRGRCDDSGPCRRFCPHVAAARSVALRMLYPRATDASRSSTTATTRREIGVAKRSRRPGTCFVGAAPFSRLHLLLSVLLWFLHLSVLFLCFCFVSVFMFRLIVYVKLPIEFVC